MARGKPLGSTAFAYENPNHYYCGPFFKNLAMKSKAGPSSSYRLGVASRALAALFGGYLLASMASIAITLWAPMSRVDATMTGMMLSFVFYLLAFIGCFACRSAGRAWLGVLLPSLVLGLSSLLAYWMKTP